MPARNRGNPPRLSQTAYAARPCARTNTSESSREGFKSIRSMLRRARHRGPADHARRKISVPFVPPKPKEFDKAARIGIFRAVFGT